ncbi:hypothetical protein SLA2020_249690 [Shorea laevis]
MDHIASIPAGVISFRRRRVVSYSSEGKSGQRWNLKLLLPGFSSCYIKTLPEDKTRGGNSFRCRPASPSLFAVAGANLQLLAKVRRK